MTSNLQRRMKEHKQGVVGGFTQRYRTTDLLWFESFAFVHDAIAREKQLKAWHRDWKWNLIRETNPELVDCTDSLIRL